KGGVFYPVLATTTTIVSSSGKISTSTSVGQGSIASSQVASDNAAEMNSLVKNTGALIDKMCLESFLNANGCTMVETGGRAGIVAGESGGVTGTNANAQKLIIAMVIQNRMNAKGMTSISDVLARYPKWFAAPANPGSLDYAAAALSMSLPDMTGG